MLSTRLPLPVENLIATYNVENGIYDTAEGPNGIHTELEVLRLWYDICFLIKPRYIIETGVYQGLSTCFFAAALRDLGHEDGQIYGVDPWEMPHLWDDSDLSKFITWLPMLSSQASPSLCGREYDLLVLDSEHTYRTVNAELLAFEPLLREGGYIIFHDSLFHDGVGHAVRALYESPRFEIVSLETPRKVGRHNTPMGMTLARKIAHGAPFSTDPGWVNVQERDPQSEPYIRRAVRSAAD